MSTDGNDQDKAPVRTIAADSEPYGVVYLAGSVNGWYLGTGVSNSEPGVLMAMSPEIIGKLTGLNNSAYWWQVETQEGSPLIKAVKSVKYGTYLTIFKRGGDNPWGLKPLDTVPAVNSTFRIGPHPNYPGNIFYHGTSLTWQLYDAVSEGYGMIALLPGTGGAYPLQIIPRD
ncbi:MULTISPECIES: hypothetical protein [Burkholderia]|uniref:hypothetical protein n=1 Tax=Burkholderia TaxID=32008 RepID=UPI000B1CE03A|nr:MULTISPECIES: hypothetical protein [unclassified Burkholderia]